MTFHPRMKSRVEGVSVIGDLRWRSWQGVVADVWSVNCAPDAAGEYVSEDPRLFVTLDKSGDGSFGVGLNTHAKGSIRSSVPSDELYTCRLASMGAGSRYPVSASSRYAL